MFTAGTLAVDAARRHATSALPEAPVVEDAGATPARATLAAALRAVATVAGSAAERLDPRHRNPSPAAHPAR